MAKYMRIDPGDNYRLPADVDLGQLAHQIEAAVREGTAVRVTVEMEDEPRNRAFIVINGRTVHSVRLAETPEPS
jgi:hypothetical protein